MTSNTLIHEAVTNYLFQKGHSANKQLVDDILLLIKEAKIAELKSIGGHVEYIHSDVIGNRLAEIYAGKQ